MKCQFARSFFDKEGCQKKATHYMLKKSGGKVYGCKDCCRSAYIGNPLYYSEAKKI